MSYQIPSLETKIANLERGVAELEEMDRLYETKKEMDKLYEIHFNNFSLCKQISDLQGAHGYNLINGVVDYHLLCENPVEKSTHEGGFFTWLMIIDKHNVFQVAYDNFKYANTTKDGKHIVATINLGSTTITSYDEEAGYDNSMPAYCVGFKNLNKTGKELINTLKKIYPEDYFTYEFYTDIDT